MVYVMNDWLSVIISFFTVLIASFLGPCLKEYTMDYYNRKEEEVFIALKIYNELQKFIMISKNFILEHSDALDCRYQGFAYEFQDDYGELKNYDSIPILNVEKDLYRLSSEVSNSYLELIRMTEDLKYMFKRTCLFDAEIFIDTYAESMVQVIEYAIKLRDRLKVKYGLEFSKELWEENLEDILKDYRKNL